MALTVGTNSWVSISDALILAEERVDLADFIAYVNAEEEASPDYSLVEAALIQAYHSLKRYLFLVPGFTTVKPEPFLVTDLTEEEFAQLPEHFTYALKLAQILEASNLLNLDSPVEAYAKARRQAGIIEEQVGESRTVFAPFGGSAESVTSGNITSTKALLMLTGYIYRTVKLARA
jgi:hypothetical protein